MLITQHAIHLILFSLSLDIFKNIFLHVKIFYTIYILHLHYSMLMLLLNSLYHSPFHIYLDNHEMPSNITKIYLFCNIPNLIHLNYHLLMDISFLRLSPLYSNYLYIDLLPFNINSIPNSNTLFYIILQIPLMIMDHEISNNSLMPRHNIPLPLCISSFSHVKIHIPVIFYHKPKYFSNSIFLMFLQLLQ